MFLLFNNQKRKTVVEVFSRQRKHKHPEWEGRWPDHVQLHQPVGTNLCYLPYAQSTFKP